MTISVNRDSPVVSHSSQIRDQFSRQAEIFAAAPSLHNEAALSLLVDAAGPTPTDVTLDVACGPGSVVAAFATRVRQAAGIDATEAMLEQGRKLAAARSLTNAQFHCGDAYALPFADRSFDVVSCRFAFHHFEEPPARICRDVARLPAQRPHRGLRCVGVGRSRQSRQPQSHGAASRSFDSGIPDAGLFRQSVHRGWLAATDADLLPRSRRARSADRRIVSRQMTTAHYCGK